VWGLRAFRWLIESFALAACGYHPTDVSVAVMRQIIWKHSGDDERPTPYQTDAEGLA
jgi:hypothetical protein